MNRSGSDLVGDLVTLCSVITPHHRELLSYNIDLTNILNSGSPIRWVVVNNHELHLSKKKSRLRSGGPVEKGPLPSLPFSEDQNQPALGIEVLSGPTIKKVRNQFASQVATLGVDEARAMYLFEKYAGSYHHAAGLRVALKHVRTRFALLIDPDLYVVRRDWVSEIVNHMLERDLAAFGVPWNPRWYQKYRYFPCTHFLMLDCHRLDRLTLPLEPDLVRFGPKFFSAVWRKYLSMRGPAAAAYLLQRLPVAISDDVRQRKTVGKSRDTGYGLAVHMQKLRDYNWEIAQPVYRTSDGFIPESVSMLQSNLLLNAILPDNLSYLPKRRGYFSSTSFSDFGYPNFRALGWEEFLWQGTPFAVHVRGELQRERVGTIDVSLLLGGLNEILQTLAREPIASRTFGGLPEPRRLT